VKKVKEILLQLSVLNEVWDNKASRDARSFRPNDIRLPLLGLAPNGEHAAKDIEAVTVHYAA